jgi:hypothetical protein
LYKHEISSQILGGMVEKKEGERDLWFCWVWGFKGDSINKTTKSDYLSLPPLRFSEGREGKPISSAGSLAFTDIVSLSSCLVILERSASRSYCPHHPRQKSFVGGVRAGRFRLQNAC